MAWCNLQEDLEEEFGQLQVTEVRLWGREGRQLRDMHVARASSKWARLDPFRRQRALESSRKAGAAMRQRRRAAKAEALGRTTCIRPGCMNLLDFRPRPGKVPSTCTHGCACAVADMKAGRRRKPPRDTPFLTYGCLGQDCCNLLKPVARWGRQVRYCGTDCRQRHFNRKHSRMAAHRKRQATPEARAKQATRMRRLRAERKERNT